MNEKYIPLYRKYRPQTLDELAGQEHIKTALKNSIELNKISHAYLFTGPRGTGKTSTARIFAKSLNCKGGPTITPCGKCESCNDITNSVPIDVIEIDAASNRKVEDAENLLEKVQYAPINGKYKIYIIDEVHMLTTHAFNALLKTLEEPPQNVIFILATTEVHKVLDTIKSRCQRFDFKRITIEDIVKHLRYISDAEGIKISDDALISIAKNSAGGMRDSIGLLDQVSVLGVKNTIQTDDINMLLGRISFDILLELSDYIISSNPNDAILALEKVYNSGNEPVQILSNLLEFLKNILIVKNCDKNAIIDLTLLNEAQLKLLSAIANNIETHQIVSLIDKCADYIKEIKLANNPKLWLEVAIIDMSNLVENTKLSDLQNRIISLESGEVHHVSAYKTPPLPVSKPEIIHNIAKTIESKKDTNTNIDTSEANQVDSESDKNTAKADDFTPMPKSKSTVSADNISELWYNILSNIKKPTDSLLKQWANPIEITPEKVVIAINNEIWLNKIISQKDIVIAAVNSVFSQSDSNVELRLPLPDDIKLSDRNNVPKIKPAVVPKHEPVNDDVSEAEIEEVKENLISSNDKSNNLDAAVHSDVTNMVVDLFDGKIIE